MVHLLNLQDLVTITTFSSPDKFAFVKCPENPSSLIENESSIKLITNPSEQYSDPDDISHGITNHYLNFLCKKCSIPRKWPGQRSNEFTTGMNALFLMQQENYKGKGIK